MSHARQQIRDTVAAAVTGLTTTGSRVYRTRLYPLNESSELPGICVYTLDESSELATKTTLIRNLTVVVEAYVKANENFDNTLDTICAEVEAAIDADASLQALVKDIHPVGFEADFVGDGEKKVGVASMSFNAMYTTNPDDPETVT